MYFQGCRWSIPSIIYLALLVGLPIMGFGQPVFQWDKTYGGDDYEELHVIRPLPNGDYILGGFTQSNPGGEVSLPSCDSTIRGDYWLIRTTIYGDVIWDKRYGGDGFDRMWSLTPTNDGGFLLGGASNSDSTCNKTSPNFGEFDYWVVKIDSLGTIQWEKSYGGSLNDELIKVLELPNNQGYLLAGHSDSPPDGNKSALNIGNNDFWVIHIDTLGNIIWDRTYGGSDYEFLWSMTASHFGNYIIGGLTIK